MTKFTDIVLEVPHWFDDIIPDLNRRYSSDEEKMQLVIDLSAENIRRGGGPFGAAIFDGATHQLIAPGVNRVVGNNSSVCHAEMMAIMSAQQVINHFNLSAVIPSVELATSAEPCAQCFGAIPWAGLTRVLCGARSSDVCAIGFDQGPKPSNWVDELKKRHIEVVCDVLRDKAKKVLKLYECSGNVVYNGSTD